MRMFAHVMNSEENVNRRRTARRSLILDAVAHKDEDQVSEIVIHNLSQTGLLMESSAKFELGEIFYLHLPEVGATPAQVRREDNGRYGCEFLAPVGKVVLSAALLRSAFELPREEVEEKTAVKVAARRFFAEQVMPVDQKAAPAVYAMTAAFTVLVGAVIMMMANTNLIIN